MFKKILEGIKFWIIMELLIMLIILIGYVVLLILGFDVINIFDVFSGFIYDKSIHGVEIWRCHLLLMFICVTIGIIE